MFDLMYNLNKESRDEIYDKIDEKYNRKKIAKTIENGDRDRLDDRIEKLLAQKEKRNKKITTRIINLLKTVLGEGDPGNFKEDEIKEIIDGELTDIYGYDKDDRDNFLKEFTWSYPKNELDTTSEILLIPVTLLIICLLVIVFRYSAISVNFNNVVELTGALPPSRVQTALGLSFLTVGMVAFVMAMFIVPLVSVVTFKKNNIRVKSQEFKQDFFKRIPLQIMNLGIIPMIFAIIGIIFFDESQLLDFAYYYKTSLRLGIMPSEETVTMIKQYGEWGFGPLKLMLVLGGITEAAAFYLGFRFPEVSKSTNGRNILPAKISQNGDTDKNKKGDIIKITQNAVETGVRNALSGMEIKINIKDKNSTN